jgi:hypothetical protein
VRARQFKTQADLDRHIANGYGAGEGESYLPWLRIQDVSSRGRSRKVQGTKVNRMHHLLSDFEFWYLLLLEFSEQVVDIREQYPLFPTPEAQQIAASLGIIYPRYPSTTVPFVMTTDFVVTLSDATGIRRTAARTLKYEGELGSTKEVQRVLEKFELEKAIWASKGMSDWKIVTPSMIGSIAVANLQWLRKGAKLERHLTHPDLHHSFLDHLSYFFSRDRTLSAVIRATATAIRLPYADGVLLFKHLIWQKAVVVNIKEVELRLTDQCPILLFSDVQRIRKIA